MTSFVGRRREIAEARGRLQQSRLVSLLGPGGVGKTRLAEEVAVRTARAFRDSVCWIDLAPVREPDSLASAAAAALSVTDQSARPVMDKILDHLHDKQVLIVVDNCEHLLDAAAELIATVLQGTSEVRILTTSREPLGIAGEYSYVLPPLSTPTTPSGNRAADLAAFESVTLLVERAQGVVADFQITDRTADAIAQLCIQLDGIPLAIELAAARLRSLSPAQLVERLDRRFALLTGGDRTTAPRQHTLQALIDWSYELCTEPERTLWARLSVFPGSFDLDAAEAICGYDDASRDQVIDLLDRLIAKSLVVVDRSVEPPRYSQLMTLREYGRDLLDISGGRDELYRRHRDHYLERSLRNAESRIWFSAGQSDLPTQWRTEHANLMAALDWSIPREGEAPAAAGLAVALRYHWITDGNLADARIRLERFLEHLHRSTRERGNVLWVTAWVALIQGDREGAEVHLAECADIADTLDDDTLRAHHHQWAAAHALFCGRTSAAIDLYQRAIAGHRNTGELDATLTALMQLAIAQIYDGRPEEALSTCTELMRMAEDHEERWTKAYALWVSSVAYFHLGQIATATDAAKQSLCIQRDFEDKICTALSIEVLAWCADTVGQPQEAAKLFGAAKSAWHGLGTSVTAFGPHITRDSIESQERVRHSIGDRNFLLLSTPSKDSTIEETIDVALGTSAENVVTADPGDSPLTRREEEVAALVAQGLSNRQIATQLVISHRTADGHLERIMNKLGFRSRAQIAAWVQQQITQSRTTR